MNLIYMKPKFDKKHRGKSAEAVDWLLLLKSGEMSEQQRREFENWLSEDPENADQFKFINAVWDSTGIIKDDPFTVNVLGGEPDRGKGIDIDRHTRPAPNKTKTGAIAVAIAAMLLIAVVGILIGRSNPGPGNIYYTSTGEQKSVLLADGSVVQLDSETKITVLFSGEQRQISMKKGRAVFSVSHDPDRPFTVNTGNIKIRAVGTKFDVKNLSRIKVSVSVIEGKVLVTRTDPVELLAERTSLRRDSRPGILPGNGIVQGTTTGQVHPIGKNPESATIETIAKGEEIIVDEQKKMYRIQPVDMKNISSWHRGRLYFKGTALQDVLDEVNIYLNKKIVIGDNSLKDVKIDMNFAIRDCPYFLNTLKKVVAVKSRSDGNNTIVITKALQNL